MEKDSSPLDTLNVSSSSDSGLDEANTAAQLNFFSNPSGTMSNPSGSKLSLPQFKTGVPIDKTILDNLEQMRIDKQAAQGSLANTLLDTLAIFPGDPSLRSQSIASRLGQRQQEEADIGNLTNAVASGRSAQEKTANINKYLNATPGGGTATQGAAPGAGAPGAGAPGALSPAMEMLSTLPPKLQPMGKLLLGTDLNMFFKLVSENSMKRPDMQKNFEYAMTLPPDQQEAYLGQILDKGTGPRSYILPSGKEQRYSPAAGLPGGLAPKAAPQQGAPIQDAEAWAKANGIPLSPNGGNRTFDQQANQFIQNPNLAAAPGTSPHEKKRGLDIPAQSRTPEVRAKLEKAGFRNTLPNEPWHFELPEAATAPATTLTSAPATVAPPPAMTGPAPGKVGTTVEDIALNQKAQEASLASFHGKEGVYENVTKRGLAAEKREQLANQALSNIKGNNYGPGTELGQSFAKFAQMAGIKLNPKKMDEYIGNLNIENARKFLSAESARQAMGAQFTAPEADAWLKAFAGIDNPKAYLKNFYQIEKAGALVDKDLHEYLLKNKGREQDAYLEWKQSGAKDRIMQENVDAFKNGKPNTNPEAKPAAQKTIKKTGMVTDKNNPNYGKSVTLYNDGSMEYK